MFFTSEALKRAGKTRTEALSIINAQIGGAIAMLRKSATALKRGSRSDKTKTLFQKIFKVKPEFVPTWLKPTTTIKDRGDVVATRCKRVAELLASGTIKFFCTINSTNCPDCSNDPRKFACSSYGDESKAPKNSSVVCLGDLFWDDMKAGKTDSLLGTLMHEPFHIYYGLYVTEHRSDAGKFGGINCIVQLVFETNSRAVPDRVHERCTNMVVRKEVGGFLSFRPEPFLWHTESQWEDEASRTGPDYIRWLQSSLNRVMGLRLAVDGIMGPATRSAVRSFQQRKGLAVDGIVGPNTEAALVAAGAPRQPVTVSTSAAGSPSSTPLPPECSGGGSANCVVLYDFAFDDDTLTAFHREQVAGIARRVISSQETSAPIKSLLILGHASPEGPPDYNIDLALRRATEVEFALVDCMEVIKPGSSSPSRIKLDVNSCGEQEIPDVSDAAKQRRVDVCSPLELRAGAEVHPALRWFETGGTHAMQPVRPGNDVQYLIGGTQTFEAMWRAILTAQNSNHYIYLLGWWLSNDLELKPGDPGSTIHRLFVNASTHGVQVRAMLWKYPYGRVSVGPMKREFGSAQNLVAVNDINQYRLPNNATIGAAILDNRTRGLFGSHHQKILIVKGTEGLIAFCGGIDINPDRVRNTNRNLGEPFHDVHCRVKGPAAFDLLNIFRERWKDHPDAKALDSAKGPLRGWSEPVPGPLRNATMYVQIARSYANGVGYQFARRGEKTALRMILKAIHQARRFIYIEDAYLVSMEISHELLKALPRIKHLTILIPHGDITDLTNPFPILGGPREQVYYRRQLFIAPLLRAANRNKVGVFYLRNPKYDPNNTYTYVHSKMMVVDDEFAIIGSVNLNRRSLTHDSEAAVGIYDASCNSLAEQLRIALWANHLSINIDEATPGGSQGREDLADGVKSAKLWYVRRPGSRVALYNKENANVEPKIPGADEEWNSVDPDGS